MQQPAGAGGAEEVVSGWTTAAAPEKLLAERGLALISDRFTGFVVYLNRAGGAPDARAVQAAIELTQELFPAEASCFL